MTIAPSLVAGDYCVGCGCTDEEACPGGCYWVAPGLCSTCAITIPAESCTASREAVAELEAFGETGCPICGLPAHDHDPERGV